MPSTNALLKLCALVLGIASFLVASAKTQSDNKHTLYDNKISNSKVVNNKNSKTDLSGIDRSANQSESIFGDVSSSLSKSWFTWGAEVGTSIDIDGYDMSTFDFDAFVGFKNSFFRTLGLGSGIHHDFHDRNTFMPLYAIIRTSFSKNERPWFLNFKTGYSFNTVDDSGSKGGFMFNAGIGFNLKTSANFKSHIILSYSFTHLAKEQGVMIDKEINHVDMIQLLFGINF